MVMKRYPNGAEGDFFYMKRAPEPRPEWIEICTIAARRPASSISPIVQDLPSLLWLINLGCIDLNPWYARCDDTDRPDFLHFDLDPGPGADFDESPRGRAARARHPRRAADADATPKTTGSKGIHVYIPIVRGPLQKDVWTFAKAIALELEARHPDDHHRRIPQGEAAARTRARRLQPERLGPHAGLDLLRPPDAVRRRLDAGDVGGDRGRRRASTTSASTTPSSGSTKVGDLWKPVLAKKGRFDLMRVFEAAKPQKKAVRNAR